MNAQIDAVLALLLTPFVAVCLLAIAAACCLVAWADKTYAGPDYTPDADVQAWRTANWSEEV